jgi:TolA-binding protein
MRIRLARAWIVASLLSFLPLTTVVDVHAQTKGAAKKKGGKKGDKPADAAAAPDGDAKPAEKSTDIELDEPPAKTEEGPVTAGQMTEEAATAKRLFESKKYGEAALALFRVHKGETGDDKGNQQLAQFDLAVSLYYLQFYQAAYGIFSEIADKPNHLRFNETLLWLARLATQLPEPADIVERVGKYSTEQVGRFNNDGQRELFWQLNYLLGRYKYRNRQYEDAISLFEKVNKKSKFYVQAQFFNGISYVQLKRSIPAVQAFQRVVQAVEDGGAGAEEVSRLRDLAFLSMARTYYSASVKLDENNSPTIDEKKLSAAVKYWNKIETGSEYWLDGLFEESWAYFMAGDYPRALGNIHTLNAPYFPKSFYPEAEILQAQIYYATCQYDNATTVVARFQKKYQPIQKSLTEVQGRFSGEGQEEEALKFFRELKAGKASVSAEIKPVVEIALGDRTLLKNLEYVRVLDDEDARFKKAPASFRDSPLGGDVRDALDLAKGLAVKNAGTLVRDRYQRELDELSEHLRDGAKILIDITSAERGKLEATAESGKFSQEDAKVFGVVKPDEEHVIWPFNGEYWRDELGFYRQVVVSKCGRLEE